MNIGKVVQITLESGHEDISLIFATIELCNPTKVFLMYLDLSFLVSKLNGEKLFNLWYPFELKRNILHI